MMEQLTIFDILDETVSPVAIDYNNFDRRLRMYVMAAIMNMGFTQYFDYEETKISVSTINTSDNNKYFPKGSATMHVYCMSDEATTDLIISNQVALNEHRKWVEGRNYDHRYFKKYYVNILTNENRQDPYYHYVTLGDHIDNHFKHKKSETYFSHAGEHIDEIIEGFYKWGF